MKGHLHALRLKQGGDIIADLSARIPAIDSLSEINQTLHALIQACPLAIYAQDREGIVKMWSPAAERIFGWTEEEALGHSLPFVQAEKNEEFTNLRNKALREPLTGIEVRRQRKDGSFIDIEFSCSPIKNKLGEVVGIMSATTDITDRKKSQARGSYIQKMLQFLAEATSVLSSSLLDRKETLTQAARLAVVNLSDYCIVDVVSENGAIEDSAVAHVDPDKAELVHDFRKYSRLEPKSKDPTPQVLRTGESLLIPKITYDQLIAPTPSARVFELLQKLEPSSLMIVPMVIRSQVIGSIYFCRNIHSPEYCREDLSWAEEFSRRCAIALDNARLYQDAQLAVRTRDEFLGIASHELKTPLSALRLQVQYALSMSSKPNYTEDARAKTERMLQYFNTDIQRLSKMVDHLFDVTSLEAGRLNLEPVTLNLGELVYNVVNRLRPELGLRDGLIEVYETGSLVGTWDRSRLEQVITNLLTNAAKYGQGKPIEVYVEAADPNVRLIVYDHGMGIPKEHHQVIFDRFKRLTDVGQKKSLGLGLYITAQIIKAHGGTIRVESKPGKGSSFIVELPRSLSH